MKLSQVLILSHECISQVINDGAYLNLTISKTINQNNGMAYSDKKFFTKISYGVIEKKLFLEYQLSPYLKEKRVKPWLRMYLLIGLYGIHYLSLPINHFLNQLVDSIKAKDFHATALANYLLRKMAVSPLISLENLPFFEKLSLITSTPLEIVEYLGMMFPEEIEGLLTVSDFKNVYRINCLKTSTNEVESYLTDNNIDYQLDGSTLWTTESLINSNLFQGGKIVAQDRASQLVALKSMVKPDFKVLDTCSAPGMKSIHLAELMGNRGSITALDIFPHKIELIRENCQKYGARIVSAIRVDALEFEAKEESFDLVLIDAPCSGLGVMHHKPDLKYRMKLSDIKDLIEIQKKLLDKYANVVKGGGILLYSTCTINRYENKEQICLFLKNHPEYQLDEEVFLLPNQLHDGFGIYRLRKEIK